MKRWSMRLTALVLTLFMLVTTMTGCSLELPPAVRQMISGYVTTDFENMQYVRPDPTEIQMALDDVEIASQQPDFYELEIAMSNFVVLYYDFYTNYFLADIHYCADTTDIYWTDEYNYCMEATTEVDAMLDEFFRILAASPHRATLETDEYYGADFFEDYEGESIWTEEYTALMDREAELITQYYDLANQSATASYDEYVEVWAPQMCQVYVDLVLVRQEIATYNGYDSYLDYAYEETYSRDYTPQQQADYLAEVREHLVPIFYQIYTEGISHSVRIRRRDEEDTLAYVEEMATNMGGVYLEAFQLMSEKHLYDNTVSSKKFESSFEVFLISYNVPYLFLCPEGDDYDFLTFAHEFGHFTNDYASNNSGVSTDVAEIFSQGTEYLSLFYVEEAANTDTLEIIKMADSLGVYVQQSCFADFEQRVYAMDPEDLNVENVFALFDQVSLEYGFDAFDFDARTFVSIPHFFTSPVYVFSYVVSNDAAMQIYQMEQDESGSGLAMMQEHLDTEEEQFLAFLESAGLESPFVEGRLESVAEVFYKVLLE